MIGGEDLEDDGHFSSKIWMMLHPTAASFPAFELNQTDHPKNPAKGFFFSAPLFPSKRSPRALGQMDAPDKADEI